MPKGIRLTEEEQARRRREIFDASVRLFLKKGFSETSMREIAAAAGIGKSTLYGYFRTKDDVLVFVVEEELAELERRGRAIARQPGSAAAPTASRASRRCSSPWEAFPRCCGASSCPWWWPVSSGRRPSP